MHCVYVHANSYLESLLFTKNRRDMKPFQSSKCSPSSVLSICMLFCVLYTCMVHPHRCSLLFTSFDWFTSSQDWACADCDWFTSQSLGCSFAALSKLRISVVKCMGKTNALQLLHHCFFCMWSTHLALQFNSIVASLIKPWSFLLIPDVWWTHVTQLKTPVCMCRAFQMLYDTEGYYLPYTDNMVITTDVVVMWW